MSNPHDRQILNSVVNPMLPLGECVYDDQSEIPEDLKDEEEDTEQVRESKRLERMAIEACEAGCHDKSLAIFAKALETAPNRSSVFNNRAQLHRLMGHDGQAMLDLNRAIEISRGSGRSACQAYCQRGLLNKKLGNDPDAMSDFKISADLGSEFAKSILVQFNPYAAMCNKMLKNVFKALETGDQEAENPFAKVNTITKQG